MGRARTREARTVAAALAAHLGGPVRAADEARFVVRRRQLAPGTVGIYVPSPRYAGRPVLILAAPTSGREREALFALAVGHHYLGHRGQRAYEYGDEGARYLDPLAEEEARAFAVAFLRALPARPSPLVSTWRTNVVSARG
ncbi:MAG: hypothetical protein AB7I38_11210 [Dehalococcoidia bacterium]